MARMIDPILAELENEAKTTARVLERVPGDKLSWKPHAKSKSLGELAWHLATMFPYEFAGAVPMAGVPFFQGFPVTTTAYLENLQHVRVWALWGEKDGAPPPAMGNVDFDRAAAQPGLGPGMSALAYLPSGESVEGAAIPAAATVWVQGRASISLRTGAQTFERRTIPTAAPAPDGGYIVPGLPEGARVVVQGAQMLLSEEYRAPVQAEGDDD